MTRQLLLCQDLLTCFSIINEAGEKVTIDYYHMEGSEYVLKSTEVTLGSKKAS